MKKKMCFVAVVGTFALLSGAQVFAAPPAAELEVKGLLKTPGCQVIAGDSNGVYDYGALSPTLIKPGSGESNHVQLPVMTKTWEVICDAETYVMHSFTDERADSASVKRSIHFGLGKVNDTGNLGYYVVRLQNAKVDDVGTNVLAVLAGAASGWAASSFRLETGYLHGWSSMSGTSGALPKSGKTFVMDMQVEPYLAGSSDMNGSIAENVHLDGMLTINYAFGI